MPLDPRPHLLLVNLGTPQAATADSVREFLDEFLSDPAVVDLPSWFWRPVLRLFVLRSRPARVAEAYESIWSPEGSPLRPSVLAALARARLAKGDAEIALEHAAVAYKELTATGWTEEGEAGVRLCFVEACFATGRR
ncbi:MAG: ferrochelatase, partial [Gemmatimonadetes bacterium]|nr:ferrochelatase [Gemmatimonadota bacterium]